MSKMIIYSVLPRLWGNWSKRVPRANGSLGENGSGKLADFDESALAYIKSLGCTHIWFVGLLEHATAESFEGIEADPSEIVKGRAGSPYAVRDYYDVAPYLVQDPSHRLNELDALIERVHQAGLRVLMDFIPNHVARTYHSDTRPEGVLDLGEGDDCNLAFSTANCFYYFPNEALKMPTEGNYTESPARATGNDCFTPYPSINDWYETVKLNYGVDYLGGGALHSDPRPVVWDRMLEILRFWASRGIDGFRCDMAEMVPEAFWSWAIPQLREEYELSFLAEIYQPHRYRSYLDAGFDYLYDKVGVYDTLRAIIRGEAPAWAFDEARMAVGDCQTSMCYFLENHDEVRLTSDFFAGSLSAHYVALPVLALSGTNPYLHYFAGELGERGMDAEGFSGHDGRTSIFDFWRIASLQRLGRDYKGKGLENDERELLTYYRRVLGLSARHSSLERGAYYGLTYAQKQEQGRHILSFARYDDEELCLVVANFSSDVQDIALSLPTHFFETTAWQSNIPLREYNLLTDEERVTTLTPLAPLPLRLEGQRTLIVSYKRI